VLASAVLAPAVLTPLLPQHLPLPLPPASPPPPPPHPPHPPHPHPLQACLVLVEQRETRYRVQWYYKLYEATLRGLSRDNSSGAMPAAESIHGSLLALGELLRHTGEFLLARWAPGPSGGGRQLVVAIACCCCFEGHMPWSWRPAVGIGCSSCILMLAQAAAPSWF
jgi:hypothetical protein